MRKALTAIAVCLFIGSAPWIFGLQRNRAVLNAGRTGNGVGTDWESGQDREAKPAAIEAGNAYLTEAFRAVSDIDEAREYLREKLPVIRDIAASALEGLHPGDKGLFRDRFGVSGLSLSAGIFRALGLASGSGEGKNLWSLVTLSKGIPTASEDVEMAAEEGDYSGELSGAFPENEEYRLRLLFSELLERLKNMFPGE